MKKKKTYGDMLTLSQVDVHMGEDGSEEEDELSEGDEVVGDQEGPWFEMGMSKEEKREAKIQWKHSVIVKLVGKRIGYHILYNRLQAKWKLQAPSCSLILAMIST